jgi:nucleoside-diphosphate-sugar epimerase
MEATVRVFLTGTTGFIGSAYAQELIGTGHQVLCVACIDTAGPRLAKLSIEMDRNLFAFKDAYIFVYILPAALSIARIFTPEIC